MCTDNSQSAPVPVGVLQRIEHAIRWHYYDIRRGEHSADPSHSGMGSDVLQGLIECLPESLKAATLAAQGKAWADFELDMPYAAPLYGTIEWRDVEPLIDVTKP